MQSTVPSEHAWVMWIRFAKSHYGPAALRALRKSGRTDGSIRLPPNTRFYSCIFRGVHRWITEWQLLHIIICAVFSAWRPGLPDRSAPQTIRNDETPISRAVSWSTGADGSHSAEHDPGLLPVA